MTTQDRSSRAAQSLRIAVTIAFTLLLTGMALADGKGRAPSPQLDDPCGLPDTTTAAYHLAKATQWGYGFDSLKADLARWGKSPFVHIDSIGATVQNRPIYMMTIEDTLLTFAPRKRVWFHARTHPIESEGERVTNQIIAQLLSSSPLGRKLRNACMFTIFPIINPDGLELAH